MGFRVPTFNLAFNLWRKPTLVTAAPTLSGACNLAPGEFVSSFIQGGVNTWGSLYTMKMSVPMLTDIRGEISAGNVTDIVEIPAASGRYYAVAQVDDVAKGFGNEYRFAHIINMNAFIMGLIGWVTGATLWPTPIP